MSGWWGGGMVLVWLVFLALIVGGLVLVVRAFTGAPPSDREDARRRALTILEERFARGEIDRNEFEERRETLLR